MSSLKILWFLCLVALSSLPDGLHSYKITVSSINLVKHLVSGFSQIRHHSKPEYKQQTREYIENYLKEVLPHELHTKQVYTEEIHGKLVEGINYMTIIPDPNVGQEDEKILVLLASYDTGPNTPGVNYGGSGSALILEVARILGDLWSSKNHSCKRASTVILGLLDNQENNLGSRQFVENWLVPNILQRHGDNDDVIYGVINFGSLFGHDKLPNSQDWPYWKEYPKISKSLLKNNYRGDFISTISRSSDEVLERSIENMWRKVLGSNPAYRKFKYFPIWRIPGISSKHSLFHGNHEAFWNLKNDIYKRGIKALTITDTGNLRGYMRDCFQNRCDDLDHVTDDGAALWKVTTEVIAKTTVAIVTDELELECLSKVFHDHRTTKGRDMAMHSEDEL